MNCMANKSKQEATRILHDTRKDASKLFLVCAIYSLVVKYQMSPQKVKQVIKMIMERGHSIIEGYITYDDLEDILRDEYDIEFESLFDNHLHHIENTKIVEAVNEGRIYTAKIVLIAIASVLTDKLGFGKQKTHQVLKTIQTMSDKVYRGELSLLELSNTLEYKYEIILR